MALPPTNPPGLVRDAEDLNKVVNGDGTTNRAGDSLPSLKAILGVVEARRDSAVLAIDSAQSQTQSASASAIQSIQQAEADTQGALDDAVDRIITEGEQAAASTGWFIVGEFDDGFEYTARNQVGRDSTGELWSYNGSLPYTVTAGTIPSEPTYTNRGDAALRSDLIDESDLALGSSLIRRSVVTLNSLKDLGDPRLPRREDLRYENDGFYADSLVGGGSWKWKANEPKANHNGGTIVDPNRIDVWDGTQGDLATLFEVGSGSGCFVRLIGGEIHSDMFGIVADNYATDQFDAIEAMLKAINALGSDTGAYRDIDVFIRGGLRAEVRASTLKFPNARYYSDKVAVRLPFTIDFAATDPGYAVQLWGGEYHNFDFDGFRQSNGVGTSPSVPSVGQGAAVVFSGARSYLYNCDVHGSVYPAMVTFSPEKAPVLTDCHIYDAGEHLTYFSGSSDGVRFIRCKFGSLAQNPDQGARGGLIWKFRPDNNPDVDCEFIDCVVDITTPAALGASILFTALASEGVVGWKLKNFKIKGLRFLDGDLTERMGNINLDANAELSNVVFEDITNCPSLWMGGSVDATARITGNRLKNVTFKGGVSGLAFFDDINNIKFSGSALISPQAGLNSISNAFRRGDKTVIKNMEWLDGGVDNNNIRLPTYLGKTLEFEDLNIIYSAAGNRLAPIEIENIIPADSDKPQKYVFRNSNIESEEIYSIRVLETNASGGLIELEFDGGRIDRPLRGPALGWSLLMKNGFNADFETTLGGKIQIVVEGDCQKYSSDETCDGVSFFRKMTIPSGQTSTTINLAGTNLGVKSRDMEFISRATPMQNYAGSLWVESAGGWGQHIGVYASEAPTEDLDVLVEVRLQKW